MFFINEAKDQSFFFGQDWNIVDEIILYQYDNW